MHDVIKASDPESEFVITGTGPLIRDGSIVSENWDFALATDSNACQSLLAQDLEASKVVGCNPGIDSIAQKSSLLFTMNLAFGAEDAALIMPRSFMLPVNGKAFELYAGSKDWKSHWILKTTDNDGRDLQVVPTKQILEEFGKKSTTSSVPLQKNFLSGSNAVVVQEFENEQYSLHPGRPMTLRVWAILAGGGGDGHGGLLRSYLFHGGSLRFGDPIFEDSTSSILPEKNFSISSDPAAPNRDGLKSEPLHMLEKDLLEKTGGEEAFQFLWDNIKRSVASTFTVAVPNIRKRAQTIHASSKINFFDKKFLMVGFDYILTADLKPKLSEVQYLPGFPWQENCKLGDISVNPNKETAEATEDLIRCEDIPIVKEWMAPFKGMLEILKARQEGIEERHTQAIKEVENFFGQPHGGRNCSFNDSTILWQVMDSIVEHRAGSQNNFDNITPLLYASLACIEGNVEVCDLSLPNIQPSPLGSISDNGQVSAETGSCDAKGETCQQPPSNPPAERQATKYLRIYPDKEMSAWFRTTWWNHSDIDASTILRKICILEKLPQLQT